MIFVKLFFAPLVAVASRVVSHREALHDELFVLAGAERKTLWHKNFPIYAQDPFGGSVEVTRLTGGEAISTIAFFAPKGSLIRRSADKLMPWYLKWFGTPGERAEYMLGTIYRWVTENPTTAFTAAAATAVTGGLAYYWYRSRGRPSERVVDDTVLHAINRTAKEIEQKDPNLNATMAVSELQAARGAALQAAAEGECNLTHSGEQLSKKRLELLLLRHQQAEETKLAPLTAECNGIKKDLSWDGPAKVLIMQLEMLLIA